MNKNYSTKGKHLIFDLYGIDSLILNDVLVLKNIYKEGIKKSGATIRKYQHELFEPEGITFTYILSESHASCHTYPHSEDDGTGALLGCIHTCGMHVDPNIAVNHIIKELKPKEVYRQEIIRGVR